MNPYSRLKEIMEEQGEVRNGYEMGDAVITRVSPLVIKIQLGECCACNQF